MVSSRVTRTKSSMLDPHKQMKWFYEFLEAAKKFPDAYETEAHARAWAKAMSLIVEQVLDIGEEPAEVI